MKIMRRWKQIITVLLSTAMLVTTIPQTATVSLAAGEGIDITNETWDDTGNGSEDEIGGNTDSGDGTGIGENTGSESGDEAGGNTDSGSGDKTGEDNDSETGDEIGDEPEEVVDDDSDDSVGEETEEEVSGESDESMLEEDTLPEKNVTGVEAYSDTDYDYQQFSREETNDGETSLHISLTEIENNLEFTGDISGIVKEILANYNGKVYTVVSIDAEDNGNKVINSAIYNAAVGYLDSTADDRRIDYNFYNEDFDTNWNFWHPSATMTEDINAEAALTNDGTAFSVSVSRTSVWSSYAEDVSINFYVGDDGASDARNERSTFISIFGTEECDFALYNDTVENNDSGAYWNGSSGLSINSVQNLEAGISYTIAAKTYNGEVYEEDGECRLSFSQFAMEENGLDFTAENIRSILSGNYDGQTFDVISIDVKSANETDRTFDSDIYNAFVPYLRTDYEKRRIDYSFIWDGHYNTCWTFNAPVAQMTAGLSGNVSSSVSEENLSISFAETSAFAGSCEGVSVNLWMEKASDKYNELKGVLGDASGNDFSLYTEGAIDPVENTGVYWDGDENGGWLSIDNIQNLDAKTVYKVMEYVYRGYIWEEDDGSRSIWISALDAGKDNGKFDAGELASIIDWYAGQDITFKTVHIEEKYTANNVIKKDYINKAITILSYNDEPLERRLTFGFCSCEGEDGDIVQNDMRWTLYDPGTAAKDINANVALTTTENYGVTIKLKGSNTFNAFSVSLEYLVDRSLPLANEIEAALGTATSDWRWLAVLKAGTVYEENIHSTYWLEEDDREKIDLNISCVQRCIANTNYVITDLTEVEQSYNIGEKITLTEEENFALPDDAAKVTWRSHSTNIVTISGGIMTVVNEGEAYISVSYTSGGKACLKVFRFDTSNHITSIAFDRQNLTMKLEKGENDAYLDCREYLNVKFYPSDSGCDTNDEKEMTWESSDTTVAVIERDENGTPYVKAVAPGTAVIKATYVKDHNENETIPVLTAECDVTVLDAISIADEAYPDYDGQLVAVTNFDTTLSDVELPDHWEWVVPNTSLTPFKDMDGHEFAAYYTVTDVKGNERTETYTLYVRMVTITGVSIAADAQSGEVTWKNPITLSDGEKVIFDIEPIIQYGDYNDIGGDAWKNDIAVSWSSSPKNIGKVDADTGCYTFEVGSDTSSGKKTFTVTVTNTKTKKVLAKSSYSLIVTKNSLVDFDEDVMFDLIPDEDKEKTGTVEIKVNKDKYDTLGKKKITVKSEDTSILTLGKATVLSETEKIPADSEEDSVEYIVIKIPYTQKSTGRAHITVTAADEINSSRLYEWYFADKTPKLSTSTITVNSKLKDTAVYFDIFCDDEYPVLVSRAENEFVVTGTNSDKFVLSYQLDKPEENSEYGYPYDVKLSIKEGVTVKKGSYKVAIQVPVCMADNTNVCTLETVTLIVKVVETVPSVTFKQSQKVNTFYTDEEGNGILTVTVKDNTPISSLKLSGCDYSLKKIDDTNQYFVVMDQKSSGAAKKGTLTYTLEGYADTFTKAFSVSTANSKPSIVLSAKSDTLYPQVGYGTAVLSLTDKTTGEAVQIHSARYVADKKKNLMPEIPLAEDNSNPLQQLVKSNTFNILHEGDNGVITFELIGNALAKTDKLALQVKEANWRDYIDISFSIKVDNTVSPKLKLGSSSVTLNKNDDVYQYQQVKTSLSLNGCSNILSEDVNVRFVGKDAKSNDILKVKGSLVLQYWNEEGNIIARFNNNALDKGTYKFDVIVSDGVYTTSTVLSVKVIDTVVSKCISVSSKGTIDVLDRNGTSIAYTPKLSNLTGKAVNGWLSGRDAALFNAEFNEQDGKLYVRAREGAAYSTKNTYKVKAVFWVESEDYTGFEVESKELSIKVKQGKPKVTVTSISNTLYRQLGNTIEVNISALLGTSDVVIEDVYLVNYTDDLQLIDDFYNANQGDDAENDPWFRAYNPDTGSILLTTTGDAVSILKSGKTWSVKLAIRYRDQAGNEKDTQVTYKVCVK